MPPIKIMLNGLPGNVATVIARSSFQDPRIELLPYSLTGPEITKTAIDIESLRISLIQPEKRGQALERIRGECGAFITVDFTHPTAVNANAQFYAQEGLPFVMGTTGGDREALAATVTGARICAVIAPNMAKQIVGFQAMMAYGANRFPDLFKGYGLEIRESHQKGKADTSGTAKAMVAYFNQMGIPFSNDQIQMERDPEVQKKSWGIPPEHLAGHGWHTYTLTSADGSVKFEFTHNINGREVYAGGTFDAVVFLAGKITTGASGQVFSMIDVLRG
jgi:4-hydroxy-tetrahydrodipicolinate reductase